MNLPILDLQAYEKDKSTFLKNLREIASKIGFFYLINTSIDKNLNEKLFKLGKEFFNLSRSSVFFFFVMAEINNSHLISNSSNIFLKFSKCCVARIAVGAIIAA